MNNRGQAEKIKSTTAEGRQNLEGYFRESSYSS